MTKGEKFIMFHRVYILHKLLNNNQRMIMSSVFYPICCLLDCLINENIDFTIKSLDYQELINLKNTRLSKILNTFEKEEIINALLWLKKTYVFNHVVTGFYNKYQAVFSYKDNVLLITANNIKVYFILCDVGWHYIYYIIDNQEKMIKETIILSPNIFDQFINDIDELYHLNKDVLSMILI